ncbi:MAG: NrfD/PsrC family molybdoenzyme membrane anchor subunit [Anaerolineae bacterium]
MRYEGPKEDAALFQPIVHTGRGFYVLVGALLIIISWAALAFYRQLTLGLGVTGLNRPIFMGVYIVNFVFFIGLSHAGTLTSAILRIVKAEWRRPFTRAAEAITLFSLPFGAGSILLDLGRPDRLLNVIRYGSFQSPILWDVASVSLYMLSSTFYFYFALLPDIAMCRDRLQDADSFRKRLYEILALGWTGSEKQYRRLNTVMDIMAVWLTMLVITVHTVVSWIFGMTIVPGWHTAFIGPYFLVGAILGGIAALSIVMFILRKVYHLEEFVKPVHFRAVSLFLLALSLLWFYFTFTEFITIYYGNEPAHMAIFDAKLWEEFASIFWPVVLLCFVIPVVVLANPLTRTITGTVIVSVGINIGMWLERYTVVVPSLTRPRLPYGIGVYRPTWEEWAITAGSFAAFALLFTLFTKVFPVIAVWEVHEAREHSVHETTERVRSYIPGPVPTSHE